MKRVAWAVAAAVVLVSLTSSGEARADNLASGLRKRADEIQVYLRKQGLQNVGVLKFRVEKNGRYGDRVGPLNLSLARRLETALLLANDSDKPLNIIQNASAVAAKLPGANHLSDAGQQILFAHKQYPLLWGNERVQPQALVSGLACLSADMRHLGVSLYVIDHRGRKKEFEPFVADTDAFLLVETGHSFRLRSLMDAKGNLNLSPAAPPAETPPAAPVPKTEDKPPAAPPAPKPEDKPPAPPSVPARNQAAAKDAAAQQAGKLPLPFEDKGAPVALDIVYGDQPVPYKVNPETRQAQIPGPRPGQPVRFVLRKQDKADVRYAVVLKINGESTLFKQRLRSDLCRKWVLSNKPDERQCVITGYQVGDRETQEFVVIPPAAAQALAVDYGENIGQISVEVFRERAKEEAPPSDLPPGDTLTPLQDLVSKLKKDTAVELAQLTPEAPAKPGQPAPEQPKTPAEAQQRVQDRADLFLQRRRQGVDEGGLIVPGRPGQPSQIRAAPFQLDPNPVMGFTIVYFRPASQP